MKNVHRILNSLPSYIKNELSHDEVSEELIEFSDNYQAESWMFIVEQDTIQQAESLIRYFTYHKLNICHYPIDIENNDLQNEIHKYIDSIENVNCLNDETANVMSFIVNATSNEITTKYLNQLKKANLKLALDAFVKLEEMNFGVIKKEKNEKNHKLLSRFVKNETNNGKNTTIDEIRLMYKATILKHIK